MSSTGHKPNSEGETVIRGETTQGQNITGVLQRLGRFNVAFEIHDPNLMLRASEVLENFRIEVSGRLIYNGRAVISHLVNLGAGLLCEATLSESGVDASLLEPLPAGEALAEEFNSFLRRWQKVYRVTPEFKVVTADIQTLLTDLRQWVEQIELRIRAAPAGNRAEMEHAAAEQLGRSFVPALNALHEKFEELSCRIDPDLRGAHQNFARRSLQGPFLSSPFGHRAYAKPLGYAGDYEMVNMITRDPFEGPSLFAKLMNLWLLMQYPSVAHRNRIAVLKTRLIEETARAQRSGQPARIFNLGCGPAREIEEFLIESPLSDHAHFTLLDFNDETIANTSRLLEECRQRHGRKTVFQFQRKSVLAFLKEAAKPGTDAPHRQFDFVYCAGLFDYLPDRTCKHLLTVMHRRLAPGGLLLATNVDDSKPFRNMLEFVLDWHLIYRDRAGLTALAPDGAAQEDCTLTTDLTGTNVFIEIRQPTHV